MIGNVVVVLIALGGGAVAGAALSAFITLIKLIPQMSQMTETQKSIKTYEIVFTIGTVIFTIAYFSDSNLGLSKIKIGRAHVELQSRFDLVCRLLLEKKKNKHKTRDAHTSTKPEHSWSML